MVRAFIALELPHEIRDRLKGAQDILRTCPARLTFVNPSLIHITLKFLGEVAEKDIPRLESALRAVSFQPFPVVVGTVTVNNPRRPFTVWCSILDNGRGRDLFNKVEDRLEPLGFARETRGFTPHATLARIKTPDPALMSVIRSMEEATYGDCVISGMKLKKSTLTPRGPVYEDLMEVVW
ncbi:MULTISPECIES: RNA 2',3'-cyclic phosphodiesterase [unclassified Methanoregula]|uniref:RNA 2',3'-cyclic phosphodiesterase n=1 Tax=unclassified Methanoregula TaxID=2649730 RepID=UPI0009D4F89D|nr:MULTISPECIES: RNA 2',3'-cyclic phosphodiesterase [unclassified Methanoregula]OPX62751.1 MAG: 2',5' RNA ligase family [Methanoregula sp. PtaB.Bin085]OPY36949.1 MAG: 2',5' RNA ligase family [Methanoregula sp. PtaU1.Bin006]